MARSGRMVALVLASLVVGATAWQPAVGQERAAMKPAPVASDAEAAPKLTGRLPNYYASAAKVNDEQRQEIYRLQADYDERIESLLDELEEIRDERDERIRNVLTADQQTAVDAARSAARQRRADARSQDN